MIEAQLAIDKLPFKYLPQTINTYPRHHYFRTHIERAHVYLCRNQTKAKKHVIQKSTNIVFPLPLRGYSTFTKAMVGAMRESPCKRLILMHSWYTKPEVQANLGLFYRWFLIPMIRPVLVNMYEVRR